jgi:site-specific recombinase XerD
MKIKKRKSRDQLVKLFHQWMKSKRLSRATVSFEVLQSFFEAKSIGPCHQRIIKKYLKSVSSDFPNLLLPGQVPPLAQEFIASLTASLKPATLHNYSTDLHRFHCFLIKKKIEIRNLTRNHTASYFVSLVHVGLAPGTRRGSAFIVRAYLRWLDEHRIIKKQAERLVRLTDFPKTPSYLPRPLSQEADCELQKRLHSSNSIYHQALLLMRHTGVRIGELVALPYDCVYSDSRNIHFLKVPLGKLDNERNVPLDKKTYKLLQKLRRMEPRNRLYLVPRGNLQPFTMRGYLMHALHQIARDIPSDAPISSHRLRHTYASTLLSAGVSLFGVMRLLGHRDYHMTLRYAGVTQESVLKDYFAAIKSLDCAEPPTKSDKSPCYDLAPAALLDQLERVFKKLSLDIGVPAAEQAAILKKLARLKLVIHKVLRAEQKTAKLVR